jgi:U3 small nucleolar RNA-associated protein 18
MLFSDAKSRMNCLLWVQLFFIDSGSTHIEKALIPVSYSEGTNEPAEPDPAVWEDSDDERVMISLASETRLRKLRVTEEEDIVNGKEYIWRLRRQ